MFQPHLISQHVTFIFVQKDLKKLVDYSTFFQRYINLYFPSLSAHYATASLFI
jgi:hypothetical protein